MAVEVQALYAAIAAQVGAEVPGLQTAEFVPDAVPALPMFFCAEWTVDPQPSFGDDEVLTVATRVLVARADDRERLSRLGPYIARTGAKSIRAAMASDPSFGGSCDDSAVAAVTAAKLYQIGSETFLGAEIKLTIVG